MGVCSCPATCRARQVRRRPPEAWQSPRRPTLASDGVFDWGGNLSETIGFDETAIYDKVFLTPVQRSFYDIQLLALCDCLREEAEEVSFFYGNYHWKYHWDCFERDRMWETFETFESWFDGGGPALRHTAELRRKALARRAADPSRLWLHRRRRQPARCRGRVDY